MCLARTPLRKRIRAYAGPSVLVVLILGATPVSAVTLFVDVDAPSGGDGSSWAEAFDDLQDALDAARGNPTVDEIWVAEGTYTPHPSDRDEPFDLVGGVAVYGAFAGDETSVDERDLTAHPTVLSGDLQGNDAPDFAGRGDNARHVVVAHDADGALLDGMVIRGGNFDLAGDLLLGGGGMLVSGSGELDPPPAVTVRGCRFEENSAGQTFLELGNFGGGLLYRGAQGAVVDCRFTDNRANNGGALGIFDRTLAGTSVAVEVTIEGTDFLRNESPNQTGGAMWTAAGRAVTGSHLGTITVRGCRFEENDAEYYGAWSDQNTTFLTVEECVFVRNSSIVQGGAMSHAQTGGVDLDPVRFRRSVFTDNVCTEGGGGALRLGAADGELEACVFTSNRATSGGAILAGTQFTKRGAQDLILVNCLLQGNEATFGGGILGEDNPLFRLVNTTLIDNVATGFDVAGVFTEADVVDIDGSILHGNVGSSGGGEAAQLTATFPGGVSVDYTLLEGYSGLFPGTGNLDVDPAFVDRLGPDGVAGTGDEDLAPASGSPLIDAGNNAALPAGVVTDLAGAPRFQDDPGTADTGAGTPPVVDIGALEFAGVTVGVDDVASVPGRLRVYASPNPFRRNTRIHLDLDADRGAGTRTDALRVAVVDVRGRRIRSLDVASSRDAGLAQSGAIDWDGRDDKGRSVPAGVYWIEVEGAPRARVVHTP